MNDQRIDGDGYHLGIWRRPDGSHYLALPVSSSIVTVAFDFEISEEQAVILCSNPTLKMQLNRQLHEMLQGRITKDLEGASDNECIALINELTNDESI